MNSQFGKAHKFLRPREATYSKQRTVTLRSAPVAYSIGSGAGFCSWPTCIMALLACLFCNICQFRCAYSMWIGIERLGVDLLANSLCPSKTLKRPLHPHFRLQTCLSPPLDKNPDYHDTAFDLANYLCIRLHLFLHQLELLLFRQIKECLVTNRNTYLCLKTCLTHQVAIFRRNNELT